MSVTFTPSIVQHDDRIVVETVIDGIESDRGFGFGFAVKDMKIAARLCAAISAGVVFSNVERRTDVNGRTYISATSNILGRMMNADLRRLGF